MTTDHTSSSDKIKTIDTPLDLCIIGGGLAGISAALEARKLHPDWHILVVESRTRLGGRAGSFTDPKTGNWVDNCQHVGLGCCDELIYFIEKLNVPHAFRRIPALNFLAPDGRVDTIAGCRFLPAPFHLAPSFAKLKFLSWRDKFTLGYGLLKLALTAPGWLKNKNVADWLKKNFQTGRSIRRLWEPVLVSALNDSLEKLDLATARQVFVESFFKRRDGFHLLVPAMPLGELFDEKARIALLQNKIHLNDNSACRSIFRNKNNSLFELTFRDGSNKMARNVIIATPWIAASELCRTLAEPALQPVIDAISQFQSSPITGIHLQIDRRICDYSEIALLDTTTQWIFDHTDADRRQPGCVLPEQGQSLHLVVSASHELSKKNKDEILEIVTNELKSAFPTMSEAEILSAWVVTEHSATFSPSPEIESVRPAQKTAVPGLALAGDWTKTGWPATMEGAIRSGLLAARALSERP